MIDFHVHQPSVEAGPPAYGPREYLAFMDEFGVEVSVVFTFDGLRYPTRASNDSLADWVSAAPARLIPYGTVDAYALEAPAEAERCLTTLGMRGLKFHPWLQVCTPHDSHMDAIAEVAVRHGAPLLFHDGTPPDSTPLQVAVLARRHPGLRVILGHGGLQDMWREAIAAVNGTPDVFICLCATPNIGMREVLRRCPEDRILFGTDAGLAGDPRVGYVAERIHEVRALDAPQALQRAMLFDNPRRLLGLSA